MGDLVQLLVTAGHSWPDVQKYTLGEIGVFVRAINNEKKNKDLNDLVNAWKANNLTQKGINSLIEDRVKVQRKVEKKKVKFVKDESEYTKGKVSEEEARKATAEWDRLSGAIARGFR